MHDFKSPEEFSDAISKLESYGYVIRLARQPGRKEARYGHLLSGTVNEQEGDASVQPGRAVPAVTGDAGRIAALEEKVDGMQRELNELKQALLEFKRQFE
jgi:hypothetical protein